LKSFVDFEGKRIRLSTDSELHILQSHPEIELSAIHNALKDPDEVRRSSHRKTTLLYYRIKSARRFICVVVKVCDDGNFIASAMTPTKPKTGEVIYVRKA
jgi:oligoribonuclease (3'-5' exoribonuclease)